MKYKWEPNDVVMGRRVTSHNAAENYIIGWIHRKSERGNLIYLISGRDGMLVGPFETAAEMADHLNESGSMPLTIDPYERIHLTA